MSSGSQDAFIIHGHFYQPPRENPWIEEIELEESAAPYHDWNERIVSECYRPNSRSRVVDPQGRILDIVNNYALMSFDFAPTILGWLERKYPRVYARVVASDRESLARLGHGNAIAGPYHHAILPLCNDRDLETQLVWGKEDFRHRFGREPEAMWLPETAVSMRVVAALVRHGMRFCILAPTQAEAVRPLTGGDWADVSAGGIDTTQPYRCFAPEGGSYIDVFFYDGEAAHAVSFGDILSDARRLVERIAGGYSPVDGRGRVFNVAVDGETFGHHRPLADMAAAYALSVAAPEAGLEVTNYAAFLDGSPPAFEVRLKPGPNGEGTAWSCAHGLGRWRWDCGCQTGGKPGWNQAWRGPLREALTFARDRLAPFFEEEASRLLADPWAARNAYVRVVLRRGPESQEAFFKEFGVPGLNDAGRIRALKLLEMQRHCLMMFTSCGWFFADISGIEAVQVLRYAARAMELAAELGLDIQREFLDVLAAARSNVPGMGSGRDVYTRSVCPSKINLERVVNHFAIASIFESQLDDLREIFHFRVKVLDYERRQRGAIILAVGVVELTSGIIPEPRRYLFAMSFLGGYFFRTGVQQTTVDNADGLENLFFSNLERLPGDAIQLVEEVFNGGYYSLRDVFKEQKKRILEALVRKEIADYYVAFDHVFETTRDAMEEMIREGLTVPEEFRVAAEKTLARRLHDRVSRIGSYDLSTAKIVESDIRAIVGQARLFGLSLDTAGPREHLGQVMVETVGGIVAEPTPELVREAAALLDMADSAGLEIDLTESQNLLMEFLCGSFPKLAREAAHPAKQQRAAQVVAWSLLSLAERMNFNVERHEAMLEAKGEASAQ